ncbi:hypothetical protein [Cryobacterium sp. M15]|uniref:hypothetical protein n=1 Tax=Cryobacterium sp. M15 TaxID=2048291 RepID=UPI000CE37647|nr:hypothetical protein [Cryobacterium sp. M15]
MRDTELALRFVAFKLRLPEYSGNLKTFLDKTTSLYNDQWEDNANDVEDALKSLDSGIDASLQIFGADAFRRFVDGRYESLFNRAVFDVQCLYLSAPSYAKLAMKNPKKVKRAFETLLTEDPQFATAVTSTTKSLGATFYRLEAWGKAFFNAIEIPAKLPFRQQDGRIGWGIELD